MGRKTVIQFIPAVAFFIIGGGLQLSGVEIPWLGFSLMVFGGLLLLIPVCPQVKRINWKTFKRGWVTCDKCGFIGVRNIKTRELEEMEDNQRRTGQLVLTRLNSLGDTEPRHEKIPECIMQEQDFTALPPLSTHSLPLFYMQFPRQCRHFKKWQKGFSPKEHQSHHYI